MKKVLFIFALIIPTVFCKAQSQPNLYQQLQNFPLQNYLNKPIDTLLAHLPAGYDTAFVIGSAGSLNVGATLQVNYMPNYQFWVYISITDAQYITVRRNFMVYKPAEAWPLALLRKEKIGSVTVYTGGYEIINKASIY
jgi:hypothetical protein